MNFFSSHYYNRSWSLREDAIAAVITVPDRTLHASIRAAQVFPAVDLRNANVRELSKYLTPRAFLEISEGRDVDEALSGAGSVGCALSHISLWKALAERSNRGLLILEDDALIVPGYSLEKLYDMGMASGKELVLFGYWGASNQKWASGLGGLHGYFIRSSFARKLLEHVFPINQHIDKYLYMYFLMKGRPTSMVLWPEKLVQLRNLPSTLGHIQLRGKGALPVVLLSITVALLAIVLIAVVIAFARMKKRRQGE